MRVVLGGLLAVSLALVVACGGSGAPAPSSPTGPSAVTTPATTTPPPATGVTGGATISGTVVTSSSPSGIRPLNVGLAVQVVGTEVSATVGADGSFSLEGVPSGEVRLRFSGEGHDATLTITGIESGQRVEIRVVVSGSTATLDADSRNDPGKPDVRQIEGRIEAKPASDTIVVAGEAIKIDAATVIQQDGRTTSAGDLAVGVRVHVKAQTASGVLTATRVEIQNTDTTVPVSYNGLVELLTGTAGNFSFFVNGREVRGDGDTDFFGTGNGEVGFANLRNGIRVEVKAEMRNGFAYATAIHVNESQGDQGQGQAVELSGTVGALVGTCPNLTFTVQGTTVDTSSSTLFTANCAAVANGATVQVKGLKQPGGRVLAAEVKVEDASAPPPTLLVFEGTGTISGLTGSCPLIRFGLGATAVAATVGTDFKPSCAALRNGDQLAVKGTRTTADGPVTATSIKRQ